MLIEVREGKKVISSREVEIKELNLSERGKFLDLLHDFYKNPAENLFSRSIEMCRLCTDFTDDELNDWGDAEFLQLFNALVTEKSKKKSKNSGSK